MLKEVDLIFTLLKISTFIILIAAIIDYAYAIEVNSINYKWDIRTTVEGGVKNTTNYNFKILLSQHSLGYNKTTNYRWYLGGLNSYVYYVNESVAVISDSPPGSGGGGENTVPTTVLYDIVPKTLYLQAYQGKTLRSSFYIDNLEFSYPLEINLTSDLKLDSTNFYISPRARKEVRFTANTNTSGNYNTSIVVRVKKTDYQIRMNSVAVNYEILLPKEINTLPYMNITIIDILTNTIGNVNITKETLRQNINKVELFFNKPVTIVVAIVLSLIGIILIYGYSGHGNSKGVGIGSSILALIMTSIIGIEIIKTFFIMQQISSVESFLNNPAIILMILALSIVGIILIYGYSTYEGDKELELKSLIPIAIITLIIVLIITKISYISRFISKVTILNNGYGFYLMIFCFIVIVCTILYLLSRRSSTGLSS